MLSRRTYVALTLVVIAGLCLAYLADRVGPTVVAQDTTRGKPKKAARKAPTGKKGASKGEPVDVGDASWPQFLGPERNNVSKETGLLKKWPGGGPKLLTTIRGLGVGFSNIAIAGGTTYTMGNRGERELVLAISLESGEQVWEYDNGAAYHNGYGDGPRSTPTIDGDFVYALGGTGQLVCLEIESGKPVWKKSLGNEFGTQVPQWGICESVLIDGDRLVCTPGGSGATMASIDKKSGETVWKRTSSGDRAAYASAIAVDVGGVRQYVNYTSNGVLGFRASDGQMMWRDDSSANQIANCCAPVFADGMVFTASGYEKGGSGVQLSSAAGKTNAQFKYHTNDLKVHHGGLVLLDGHVYASNDSGVLVCMELKTGKTKWKNRTVGKGSLTCAEGNLVVRSEDGPVALVAASPAGHKEISRFTPGDRSSSRAWTYPVVCGGKLFLRDQEILQVYDVQER